MPYIRKAGRALLDREIAAIVGALRILPDGQRVQMTISTIKHLCKSVAAGQRLFHGDPNDSTVLAETICQRFIPDEQEGVLNYTLTRIVVGAFVPYLPITFKEWPYATAARVIKCFERTKLDLHSNGTTDTVIAALEAAKMEFYCRVLVPQERCARLDNGDLPEYTQPDGFP